MTIRVVTAPPYEPVSLAEAKRWLRVDDDITDQDAVIELLIKALREHAETITRRAYVRRALQLIVPGYRLVRIDGVERLGFALPYPPLISVESITYIDSAGAQQTMSSTLYDVLAWCEPGVVVQAADQSWPSYDDAPDAIRIDYTAGYQTVGSPEDADAFRAGVPDLLKLWIQARLATLYEYREQVITGTIVSSIPRGFADGLLDPLVVGDFF